MRVRAAILAAFALIVAHGVRGDELHPYAKDPAHPWNQVHQALFVRKGTDGKPRVHSTDPLLYRGRTWLLEGEPHRRALSALDAFLAEEPVTPGDPRKRLFLQRDLWAAFDYVAWSPDDWVYKSKHEPAAIALRTRLAKAIGKLRLTDAEFAALPDTLAQAVASKAYSRDFDPNRPEQPFLPADLLDTAGPWVRFHETTHEPMTAQHFRGAGGRAVHIVFLRLPGGRTATDAYLKSRKRDPVAQFPPGTMVAMIRRPLAVVAPAKVRVTPVTELVQLRVFQGEDFKQAVFEFVLDRAMVYEGRPGLKAVTKDAPEEPFSRETSVDPFEPSGVSRPPPQTQLQSCLACHQGSGIHSVRSMQRGLREQFGEAFRTYAWDVELKFTVHAKLAQYDWGLLQGHLEAAQSASGP